MARVLIVGGGDLALRLARNSAGLGISTFFVSSPRHFPSLIQDPHLVNLAELGIHVSVDKSLSRAVSAFGESFKSDSYNFSLSNPWILSKTHLEELFGGQMFNSHGTRLPRDRGAGSFSWQILQGNRTGVVNLYRMSEQLDAGNIVYSKEFIYPTECRLPADYQRYYEDRLIAFLTDLIGSSNAPDILSDPGASQPDYLSTYWPRMRAARNGYVDWGMKCNEVYRFLCAFDSPYDGARTFLGSREVVLKDSFEDYSDGNFHPYQSGIIFRKTEDWICVAASSGSLLIRTVLDADGKDIFGEIKVGDRFHSKAESLESGKTRWKLGSEGWVRD